MSPLKPKHVGAAMGPPPLRDAHAVAERWGVPVGHVYRLAREGRIPVVQPGKYRRSRLEDLEAFEASGGTAPRASS